VTTNAALVYNLNSFQTAAYSVGGSGSLAMIGPGMLTLSASNGYTGGTTVAAGVLQLGNSAALGAASGSLSIVAGTLDLAGYSPSVGALSGGASGAILNSGTAATLTTNTAGGSSTFAGTIADGTGTVALTTAGSGALVLTGNNTYSGATTVGGGTLTVAAGGAIGSASRIYVNGPNGAVLNVSGGVVATSDNEVWALSVGYSANQPGAVNISAGTVNLSGANSGMVMGNGGTGATAQWNQTGGLVNVGNGTIYAANNPGGSTQMVISGGTFNAGGEFWLGTRDDATLTVSGNAVVNLQGNMWINRDYSGQTLNSVFNMQGGAVSQGGSYFVVGNGLGTGTFNQTGGFFDCTSAAGSYIGNGTSGAGIMSVSGGTFTQTTDVMRLGQNGNATGSLSVGGGTAAAIVSVPTISFGNNSASAAGTVNLLSKGLLEVGTITQGPGFGTFNFDGGTLQATGVNATFMQGLTNAYVEDAGGAVDNGGYAITIAQNLQHGGSSVTDGGLIFRGAGVTTLSGTNAYNGGTTVNNGTLIVTNSQAINDGTNLSVGDPALLSLLPAPVIPGAVAGLPTEPQSAVAPVPEPGTLVLAAVAGVAAAVVAVRRKRISRRVYQ
jgi:autotransporter-associated beta strand protein